MNTETWGRDIYELINYDSVDLYLNSIRINDSGCLYRLSNRIFYTREEVSFEEYEILLKLKKENNTFKIIPNEHTRDGTGNINSLNSSWFLLKKFKINEKYNKYKINTGDIIKIGRIITRIKEIKYENQKIRKNEDKNTEKSETNSINKDKISNKFILKDIGDFTNEKEVNNNKTKKILSLANQRNATDPNLGDRIQVLTINKNNNNDNEIKVSNNNNLKNNDEKLKINNNKIKIKKQNAVCRICYGEEDEKEDPLVQPCQCSGSLKFIHLKCLKHWINTRSCVKVDENDCCTVFLFKETECEICKAKLPDLIKHNGKLYSLLEFSEEYKNYLILETLTLDDENNKFIYVISLDRKNELKVGRGTSNDILLSDVSVSRIHCFFSIEGKNVYIKDNNSKFGTLILVQSPSITMTENLPLCLQVGRTFFHLNIRLNTNSFSCCGVSENPNIFYYYNQNEKHVKLKRILTVKTDIITNSHNSQSEEEDNKEEEKEIEFEKKSKKEEDEEICIKESNNKEDDSIKVVIDDE